MISSTEEFTQSSMLIGVKGFENPAVTSVGFLRYSCMPPIVKPLPPPVSPTQPTETPIKEPEKPTEEVPKDPGSQSNTTFTGEVPQNNTTSPVGPPTNTSGEPETKPLLMNLK